MQEVKCFVSIINTLLLTNTSRKYGTLDALELTYVLITTIP